MQRLVSLLAAAVFATAACSSPSVSIDDVPELPEATADDVAALLAASQRPVVLNVWASWCAPCRSEAPLLRTAHAEHGDEIRFVGIDVDDAQQDAREFIAEFALDGFEHYFDPTGSVPASLGGRGVPLTYFVAPGGRVQAVHRGVLDERTLALQIDELRRLED